MEVNVGVSKNHVHLTKETYKSLFKDKPLIKRNDLSQPHEFASIETVDIINNGNIIKHVRVVGPFRNYDQVELCESDAKYLNLFPPRRQSGDLLNTEGVKLVNGNNEVVLKNGVILAEAHIHMSKSLAKSLGLENKQEVDIFKDNEHLLKAKIKVTDNGVLELHIDTDESKLYNLNSGSKVDFRICGK